MSGPTASSEEQRRAVPPPPATPATKPVPPATGAAPAEPEPEDDVQLSFMDHLRELRTRITRAVLMILFTTTAAYALAADFYTWLVRPVIEALPEGHKTLYFIDPVGPVFVNLKVAAMVGVFLAAPYWLFQVWAFIAPGLYRSERRMVAPFLFLGTILFFAGGWIAHEYLLPFAFQYLVSEYSTAQQTPMLDIGATLNIVTILMLAFGLVFELPLVLALLARMGLVTADWFARQRRIAIVVNVVIAAVITPTGDPFNLMLMAVPLIVFYEIGIIVARIVEKPRRDPEATDAD